MANLPLDCVDIFDDFGDADSMEVTYCSQVSDEKYQEDMRTETDKALGELCLYLDQNPEFYARVLRKRKQEEMESAGVISYVKSKMMSLLHGERYPHCLVSASECVQQTNALKTGMCKTFQLSQELKGNVTRHSARLAAKRQAKLSKKKNACEDMLILREMSSEAERSDKSVSPHNSPSSGKADTETSTASKVDNSAKSFAHPLHICIDSSQTSFEAATPAVVSEVGSTDIKSNVYGNMAAVSQKTNQLTAASTETQPSWLDDVLSTIIPTPPPAPPLPANFLTSRIPQPLSQEVQRTPATAGKGKSPKFHRKAYSFKLRTPESTRLSTQQERRSSPRVRRNRMVMEDVLTRTSSLQSLSSLSNFSAASSPFLTPDVPLRYKGHKRSQSNSSLSSLSSYGSCSSIHSEILLSNPISRLKATPVIRSPGGTPLRQRAGAVPSEPFRALYTAIQDKFKNVSTPSPRSDNVSNSSVLNNTFSP